MLDYSPWDISPGVYLVEFVGDPELRELHLAHEVVTSEGKRLYLVDEDETCYNWGTVIGIKRIGDN